MKFDYLVVGSGLSGASIARLVKDKGHSVLVLEKRNEVGGNIHTHLEEGIILHDYGPHIFHTSYEDVWAFVNRYCEMYPFINSPLANYHGELYHMPFNMNTFHELWGVTTEKEAKAKIAEEVEKEHLTTIHNLEEQALSLVGRTLYEKLIKGYTEKQWGRDCKDLPASIIKRLPLRFTYDNNYFTDKYQGLPKGGYSVLIENLLKGITVKTGIDFLKERAAYEKVAKRIIFTGRIDEYYDFKEGPLEYRSLRFENKRLPQDDYQGNPVVNYTAREIAYTRVSEAKHFDPFCDNHTSTIITFEYPDAFKEGKIPYYPINDEKNAALYQKYVELAKQDKKAPIFFGRLASYRYFDMDDTIEEALKLAEVIS